MTKAKKLALAYMYELVNKETFIDVNLVKTELVGECELSIWTSKDLWPYEKIAICDNGKEAYVISTDLEVVNRFLIDTKPDISNTVLMSNLLKMILPDQYRLLTGEVPEFIKNDTGNREEPSFISNELVFYCNDGFNAEVHRFTINANYTIKAIKVGPGIEMRKM